LSILWDFTVDTVTEDTILYAGWEEAAANVEETDPVVTDAGKADVEDMEADGGQITDQEEVADTEEQNQTDVQAETPKAGQEVKKKSAPKVKAYDVEAEDVNDALGKFADSLEKFGEAGGGQDLAAGFKWLSRIGGIASGLSGAAGGCIAILQMVGVIEDPTAKSLATILTEVHNIQDKLTEMDTKLDSISGELVKVASSIDEKDRQNKAALLLQNWMEFNTNYAEKMKDLREKYEGYILEGVGDWWKEDHKNGGDVYLLYTRLEDNTAALTFSNEEGIPEYADNGEVIDRTLCIGIPAECMPETGNFNPNTYKSVFRQLAVQALISAADAEKLIADPSFYTEWKTLGDTAKEEKAKAYAEDLFNTLLSKIACKVMTANNQFVIDVRNAYSNYCSNIVKTDSGVNALLKVMFLTHSFEREVKQDVIDYCDGLIAEAGYYGIFTLNCTGQSFLQTAQARKDVLKQFADTINTLDLVKSRNLTGVDNYCYITNTLVELESAKVVSTVDVDWHMNWNGYGYEDYTKGDWKIVDENNKNYTLPAILDDEHSVVLYHYYLGQKQGTETYYDFLSKNGVYIPEWYTIFHYPFMTSYKGAQTFSLSDALPMTCQTIPTMDGSLGDYFSNGEDYKIFNGSPKKASGDYFVVHDKVTGNFMDRNGKLTTNQIAAARAFYGESHWNWKIDEAHAFYHSSTSCSHDMVYRSKTDHYTSTFTFTGRLNYLALTAPVSFGGKEDETALSGFKDEYSIKTTEEYIKEAKALTVSGFKAKAKKKGKALVSWSANSKASGYVIQYGLKKSMKGAKSVKITNAKTKKKVLKKLKAKKKYYVRMRTLTNVKNPATGETTTAYGKWTSAKSFKAKK